MRVSNVLFLVASAPLALAVPTISSPAAGAPVPGGSLTIKWADDKVAPLMTALGTCTIQLFAGSNTVNQPILSVLGVIPAAAGTASFPAFALDVSGSAPNA
jgi:hypothetical protein